MSADVPSVPQEAGNTEKPKKASAASWWCFTLNNYRTVELLDLNRFSAKCSKIVYQSEVGECGTPHIQGVFQIEPKKRLTALKKLFPAAHFEVARNPAASIEYCRKIDTWDGKLRFEKGVPKALRVVENLRPWQNELVEEIKKEPDDRTIIWYVDEHGGKGKTTLCRYLVVNHDAIYINGGKGNDILHVTAEMLKLKHMCSQLILFDFPRTLEGKVSYSAIESIKNGLFMSTKYEGGLININSPHLVIFANWAPDVTQLSEDRWDIRTI